MRFVSQNWICLKHHGQAVLLLLHLHWGHPLVWRDLSLMFYQLETELLVESVNLFIHHWGIDCEHLYDCDILYFHLQLNHHKALLNLLFAYELVSRKRTPCDCFPSGLSQYESVMSPYCCSSVPACCVFERPIRSPLYLSSPLGISSSVQGLAWTFVRLCLRYQFCSGFSGLE